MVNHLLELGATNRSLARGSDPVYEFVSETHGLPLTSSDRGHKPHPSGYVRVNNVGAERAGTASSLQGSRSETPGADKMRRIDPDEGLGRLSADANVVPSKLQPWAPEQSAVDYHDHAWRRLRANFAFASVLEYQRTRCGLDWSL